MTLATAHEQGSVRTWTVMGLLVIAAAGSPGATRRVGAAIEGPGLPGLSVEPSAVVLPGSGARQQLAVTLHRADGSLQDVTRSCRFEAEPAGLATISPRGVVRPAHVGTGVLRVQIGRASCRER